MASDPTFMASVEESEEADGTTGVEGVEGVEGVRWFEGRAGLEGLEGTGWDWMGLKGAQEWLRGAVGSIVYILNLGMDVQIGITTLCWITEHMATERRSQIKSTLNPAFIIHLHNRVEGSDLGFRALGTGIRRVSHPFCQLFCQPSTDNSQAKTLNHILNLGIMINTSPHLPTLPSPKNSARIPQSHALHPDFLKTCIRSSAIGRGRTKAWPVSAVAEDPSNSQPSGSEPLQSLY